MRVSEEILVWLLLNRSLPSSPSFQKQSRGKRTILFVKTQSKETKFGCLPQGGNALRELQSYHLQQKVSQLPNQRWRKIIRRRLLSADGSDGRGVRKRTPAETSSMSIRRTWWVPKTSSYAWALLRQDTFFLIRNRHRVWRISLGTRVSRSYVREHSPRILPPTSLTKASWRILNLWRSTWTRASVRTGSLKIE